MNNSSCLWSGKKQGLGLQVSGFLSTRTGPCPDYWRFLAAFPHLHCLQTSSRAWQVDSANQELCTEVWEFPQKLFFYPRTSMLLHITKQDNVHIFHIFKSCFMTDFCEEVPHGFRRGNPSSCIAWYGCGPPPMQTGTTSRPLPGVKP